MKQLKTLRVRFALWVAALLLVALILFGIFVYINMAHGLLSAVDDSLLLSASQAIASVNIGNGEINFTDSVPEGTTTANLLKRGLTIRFLSPKGDMLQSSGPYQAVQVDARALAAAVDGRATFVSFSDRQKSDSVRMYTAPVIENDQLVGIIQVAQSLGFVQDTLDHLLVALLLATPLLVFLAGLGGYYLAARALAPIDAMTHTARRISAEDLSARLKLPAFDDEVGRLASTLDEMLDRLDKSFRRERRFTADASHELRTPLAAMQTILSVIRHKQRKPEDYKRALADIAEETDRMRTLTEDLLFLARSDQKLPAMDERVNLSHLLVDTVESLRPLVEKKGLIFNVSVSEDIIVIGNTDSLIRLFINLLDNAVKYTHQGEIKLIAEKNQETIQVKVSDTGVGIAAQDLPYIFDRFYRIDTSRSTRGSGLGLSIAQEIVHQHRGTLTVKSQVGQGTEFKVNLPINAVIQADLMRQ